jgi:plastocyanin
MNFQVKLLLGCFIIVFVASVFAGCASNNVVLSPTSASIRYITINESGFSPKTIEVKSGTVVTWTNTGMIDHMIAAGFFKDTFSSPYIKPGASWQHTFTEPGTYAYIDEVDHSNAGTVIVK